MSFEEDRWVSVDEICAYLSVSRDTLMKWIAEMNFPYTKIGKLWRFKLSDVDTWMKKQSGTKDSEDGNELL